MNDQMEKKDQSVDEDKIPINPKDEAAVKQYFKDLLFDGVVGEAIESLELWKADWVSTPSPQEPFDIIGAFQNGWRRGGADKECWPAMQIKKVIGYLEGWGEEWVPISGPVNKLLNELGTKGYSTSYDFHNQFYKPIHRHLKMLKVMALSYKMDK